MTTMTKEIITPDLARAYFAKNIDKNRKLSSAEVEKYKADILADRWKDTGETISFNEDGELINGQTRLCAIIAAGVPVELWVCRGVPNDAIEVIDSGRSRSISDRMTISGEQNVVLKSTTIQSLIQRTYKMLYNGAICKKLSIGMIKDFYHRYYLIFDNLYDLTTKGHRSTKKSTRNKTFLFASLCAFANGVPMEALQTFVECITANDCSRAIRLGYNYSAALKYDSDYRNLAGYSSAESRSVNIKHNIAVKAIYCFVNNKKYTTASDVYPMSLEKLNMLESRLERWEKEAKR